MCTFEKVTVKRNIKRIKKVFLKLNSTDALRNGGKKKQEDSSGRTKLRRKRERQINND